MFPEKLPTADELVGYETLCASQADDLKREDGLVRFWLSRCGLEDGEPYERTITVEEKNGEGQWITTLRYNGDNPPVGLPV